MFSQKIIYEMKIKNLKACILEEDGTLVVYDKKNLLTIGRDVYSIGNSPVLYKIESNDRVRYTDYLKAKVVDKFVYKIRKADNNNEAIYVSLTFWQNVKFILMNKITLKEGVDLIKKVIKIFLSDIKG